MDLGLFSRGDCGITVKLDRYNSGKAALAAMLRGDAEFALASGTPIARVLFDTQQSQGARVESQVWVLASIATSNGTHMVVARRSSGINQPQDLLDKRIGVPLDTSAHFGWERFADYHGLDLARITQVPLEVSEHQSALAEGRVDAVSTWEPWAFEIEAALGQSQVNKFSMRQLYTAGWLLVARPDVLTEHPELGAQVLGAYSDALDVLVREPERMTHVPGTRAGQIPDWSQWIREGVIWGLRLDMMLIADIETQFLWIAQGAGDATSGMPAPRDFVHAQPMLQVAPHRVTLPAHFFNSVPLP
jgi:NitT/TauT family transport system substrate-binding protein